MRIAFETNMFLYIFFAHMLSTSPYVHRDFFFEKMRKDQAKIRGESKTSVNAYVYTDLFWFIQLGPAVIQTTFSGFLYRSFATKEPAGQLRTSQTRRVTLELLWPLSINTWRRSCASLAFPGLDSPNLPLQLREHLCVLHFPGEIYVKFIQNVWRKDVSTCNFFKITFPLI